MCGITNMRQVRITNSEQFCKEFEWDFDYMHYVIEECVNIKKFDYNSPRYLGGAIDMDFKELEKVFYKALDEGIIEVVTCEGYKKDLGTLGDGCFTSFTMVETTNKDFGLDMETKLSYIAHERYVIVSNSGGDIGRMENHLVNHKLLFNTICENWIERKEY